MLKLTVVDSVSQIPVAATLTIAENLITFKKLAYNKVPLTLSLLQSQIEISVTNIAYKDFKFTFFLRSDTAVLIKLVPVRRELSEVIVRDSKKAIEYSGNKIILNIDKIPSSQTSNSFEMLNRIPGVVIEDERKITLNGRNVLLVINGRKLYFTNDQAVNYLRSLPASNLKAIEVALTKSAKYDAEGDNSVINVITKDRLPGVNDVLFRTNASYNKYFSSNYSLFHSKSVKTLNYNIGFSIGKSVTGSTTSSNTTYNNSSVGNTFFDNQSDYKANSWTGNINANITKVINKRANLSFRLSSYFEKPKFDQLLISKTINQALKNLVFGNTNDVFLSSELNYERKIDTIGSKYNVSLGYISGAKTDHLNYQNSTGSSIDNYLVVGKIPLSGHQLVFQADVEKKLGNFLIETGVKGYKGLINNDVGYDTMRNNILFKDLLRTKNFRYSESNFSVYLNSDYKMKRVTISAGLRFEDITGFNDFLSEDSQLKRNFSNFFPNFSVSYNLSSLKGSLSFNRSISKPGYQYLNPYIRYVDQFNYRIGNANIQPTFTYNVNLNNGFYNLIYLTTGYSVSPGSLFLIQTKVSNSNTIITRPENLLKIKLFYGNISSSFNIVKALESSINLSANQFSYIGDASDPRIASSLGGRFLYNASIFEQYKFNDNHSAEISYYYYSKRNFAQSRIANRSQLNISYSGKTFNKALTYSIAVNDILKGMRNSGETFTTGYYSSFYSYGYARRVTLGLNYLIGKINSQEKRSILTDESKRYK